jgi:hypothetical protein
MPKKIKPPLELKLPETTNVQSWLVVGLDLSLSRTGFAFFQAGADTLRAISIGSFKPVESADPVWVRSYLIATALLEELKKPQIASLIATSGVILAFEAPTPRNDFLTTISRIVSSVLLTEGSPLYEQTVRTLYINASTLRSVMGLVKKGANNKVENKQRAWQYVPQAAYPGLDTDACDAVLMAVMGVYTSRLISGNPDQVPQRFIDTLCNASVEVKGKVRKVTKIKGVLHRPEYWATHTTKSYELHHRDARQPAKSRPNKLSLTI